MKKWCERQMTDSQGQIICAAHLAEGRAPLCPYKNNEERQDAEYPCSDYEEGGKEG